MAAISRDPKFASKVGVPQKVGQDFNRADAGTGILSGPRPKKPAPTSPPNKLEQYLS